MLYHIGYTYKDRSIARRSMVFNTFKEENIKGNYFLTERGWDVWYKGKWYRAK